MLKYDPYDYLNTQELKYSQHYTEEELKSAYSYLRNVANKRISRLESAGFTQSTQYQRIKALGLPILKDIKNRSELAMRLQQVSFFVSLKTSTVSGIREVRRKRIEQFKNMGFTVNGKNIDSFLEFFERVKELSGKYYLLELMAKVYNSGVRRKLTPEQIFNNYKKLMEK